MYYIIKEDQVIAKCDYEPNIKDLETRGEFFIERELDISLRLAGYKNGELYLKEDVDLKIAQVRHKLDKLINSKVLELIDKHGLLDDELKELLEVSNAY